MPKESISQVKESPEGGYEAWALGHSIFTEADNLEKLKERVAEAVRCHFDDDEMPTVIRLHVIRREVLTP
ncbi:MAG TPA: 2-oxoisovalerate dehydrogenase [bacterium]|nr:2-oxoisovalerate dehydrogenase [bacterium]